MGWHVSQLAARVNQLNDFKRIYCVLIDISDRYPRDCHSGNPSWAHSGACYQIWREAGDDSGQFFHYNKQKRRRGHRQDPEWWEGKDFSALQGQGSCSRDVVLEGVANHLLHRWLKRHFQLLSGAPKLMHQTRRRHREQVSEDKADQNQGPVGPCVQSRGPSYWVSYMHDWKWIADSLCQFLGMGSFCDPLRNKPTWAWVRTMSVSTSLNTCSWLWL